MATRRTISLVGLDKAAVLAALYNASDLRGLESIRLDPQPMTTERAREILDRKQYLAYLVGPVLTIDISTDELDPQDYDRKNGQGTAQRVINGLRQEGNTNSMDI